MIQTKLADAEKRVRKAEHVLRNARRVRDVEAGRSFALCCTSVRGKGCGKMTQLRRLIYLQTHSYVSPYGCAGGAYWKPGEGQFDCPKCGNRNRLYNRPKITGLKHDFKNVKDVYDE